MSAAPLVAYSQHLAEPTFAEASRDDPRALRQGAALTTKDRAVASDCLRRYLEECYRLDDAELRMPTFGVRYEPVDVEDALARKPDPIGRRPVGTHSDPTPREAIARAFGVFDAVPVMAKFSRAYVARMLDALPGHLYEPLHRNLVLGRTQAEIAAEVGFHPNTVSLRVLEALSALCESLYGERWVALN